MKIFRRHQGERGAALVEFAVLAPLLLLLLFGIIEFAWLFSENLDVRHGAREGARLAATDDFTDPTSPQTDVCGRMDTANVSGDTLISISRTGDEIGDDITLTVDAPPQTLTGFMDWAIPAGTRLTSTITVRMEQKPTWSVIANEPCP